MIKDNRFSRYMLYAFGEIVLVVAGILIAVSINGWNNNQQQTEIDKLVRGLEADLKSNIKDDTSVLDYTLERNEQIKKVLEGSTTKEMYDSKPQGYLSYTGPKNTLSE